MDCDCELLTETVHKRGIFYASVFKYYKIGSEKRSLGRGRRRSWGARLVLYDISPPRPPAVFVYKMSRQ